MADYATQLRSYVDLMVNNDVPDLQATPFNERIALSLPHIFDFDFPIYDENYRTAFETKIIRRFYMREIGQETVGLWKFNLETWLNQKMPYYNKLYLAVNTDFNLLDNVNYHDVYTRSNDSKRTTDGKQHNIGDRTVQGNNQSMTDQTDHGNKATETDSTNKSHTDEFTNQDTALADTQHAEVTDNQTTDSTANVKLDETSKGDSTTDSTKDVTSDGNHVNATKTNNQELPQNRLNAEDQYATTINVKNDNGQEHNEEDSKGHSETDTTNSHNATTDTTTHSETNDDKVSDSHEAQTTESHANTDSNTQSSGHDSVGETTDNNQHANSNTNTRSKEDSVNKLLSNEQQKFNNLESYAYHRVGKVAGTDYATMIRNYMDAMINVDDLVLDTMDNDLFMGVFL